MQSIRFTLNLDFRKVNPIYKPPDVEEGIEVKECRICLDSEEEEENNPLLCVCGCKGSTKYVHKECIEKWINMHSKNHENHNKCQICTQDFNMNLIIVKNKKNIYRYRILVCYSITLISMIVIYFLLQK